MRNDEKILALTLTLSTFVASAFAEQPKAAEYKQMMSSGNFYIEYELNDVKKFVKNGNLPFEYIKQLVWEENNHGLLQST